MARFGETRPKRPSAEYHNARAKSRNTGAARHPRLGRISFHKGLHRDSLGGILTRMNINEQILLAFIHDFSRLSNKFGRLEKQPIDFGTGDLLYPAEIHVIDAVENGINTVTSLGEHFGITKGAASQTVKKLTEKGFVRKARNPGFSKEVLVSLTEKGRTASANHRQFHRAMDEGLIRRLKEIPQDQAKVFQHILEQIEEHIDHYLRSGE